MVAYHHLGLEFLKIFKNNIEGVGSYFQDNEEAGGSSSYQTKLQLLFEYVKYSTKICQPPTTAKKYFFDFFK